MVLFDCYSARSDKYVYISYFNYQNYSVIIQTIIFKNYVKKRKNWLTFNLQKRNQDKKPNFKRFRKNTKHSTNTSRFRQKNSRIPNKTIKTKQKTPKINRIYPLKSTITRRRRSIISWLIKSAVVKA